jgi:GAF domain-containing protein
MNAHNAKSRCRLEHEEHLRDVVSCCNDPISKNGGGISRFGTEWGEVRRVLSVEGVRHVGVLFGVTRSLLGVGLCHDCTGVRVELTRAQQITGTLAKADASLIENARLEPRSVKDNEQVSKDSSSRFPFFLNFAMFFFAHVLRFTYC